MGSSFGVFYCANASGYYNKPVFYKTSGSGAPSEDLVIYDSEADFLDVYWDGKRFVVLTGASLNSWIAHNVLQIFTLDANGKLISEKAQIISSPPTTCSGISLLQIKKSKYLILTSGECPGAGVGPPADRYDLFAGQVKVKTKGISNISLQNTSRSLDSGWNSPSGVAVGNNYYVAASHGCGLAVARINDKGQVTGTPLYHVYGA